MKKNIPVATTLKQMAYAACLLGMMSGQASAQFFGQPAEAPSTQSSPPVPANSENYNARDLPSISNTRGETRTQQNQQSTQRSNRTRSSQEANDTRNDRNDRADRDDRDGRDDRDDRNGRDDREGRDARDRRKAKDKKNTFAPYVQTVTGTKLELFGNNLFSDVPTTFAPFDSAQVNADYVIGTGDELQIRGWGMVNVDITATVDRSGAIYIPRVGAVKVAGIKYRDLQGYLKKAISKNFNNFELTASISQTRDVQIYVVGHAVRPGTYTLNSMSTLLNALFTSGGPNSSGSMRNIQLKRGTETVTTFDLYDMLVHGNKSRDVSLHDGDVIYIPEIGPLVALSGNVKTPAIFELNGKSSLADLIGWAGGVDSASDQKQITVEKTVNNTFQTMAELVADKSTISTRLAGIPIHPADVIRVFAPGAVPVQAQLQNEYVRVSGEVKQSGVFQIKKGETLRELMFRLGGSTETGYIYATQLKRESVKRSQQLKLDEIADRFERDLESAGTARLSGTTDKDAVTIQQAELERQRRVAEKLRMVKAEGRIVLELQDGDAQVKNLPELALQDGDSIFVPRKPGTVEVLGSVFQSNSFIYKPHRNVKDYLLMAGGGTASADTSEMYVIRADGTAKSGRSGGWFGGIGGAAVNPGDTIVVPETIERGNFRQSLKEWTTIFYQFGLGAAGLKVLKD
jgi:polysaccharide biosynthesis/export protein